MIIEVGIWRAEYDDRSTLDVEHRDRNVYLTISNESQHKTICECTRLNFGLGSCGHCLFNNIW